MRSGKHHKSFETKTR